MLGLLSKIYEIAVNIRNRSFDSGRREIKNIENIEITCIGNITAGGTGKTPAVHYFIKKMIEEGKKPCVVSRGYGGRRKKEPLVVSDGKIITATPYESGDESYLHALNLRCPVIVAKERYKAVAEAKEKFGCDSVVMDDGFQHRQLYREHDIVLIDAMNPFGGEKLLPAGYLREPIEGLKRAEKVIITRCSTVSKEKIEEIKAKIKLFNKNIALSDYVFSGVYNFEGKEITDYENKRVFIFSGIGNPKNFKKSVEKTGVVICGEKNYRDHYKYREKDISDILEKAVNSGAEMILTTEKDMVKIMSISNDKFKEMCGVLKIEFKMLEENI